MTSFFARVGLWAAVAGVSAAGAAPHLTLLFTGNNAGEIAPCG